jgi:hypothetical protein
MKSQIKTVENDVASLVFNYEFWPTHHWIVPPLTILMYLIYHIQINCA